MNSIAWCYAARYQAVAGDSAVGDKRGGNTHVLYDPAMSNKGVLSAAGRAPRQSNPFDIGLPMIIKAPHALPMFREERIGGKKRQREKARQVRRPWLPVHCTAACCKLSAGRIT